MEDIAWRIITVEDKVRFPKVPLSNKKQLKRNVPTLFLTAFAYFGYFET